MTLGQRIRSGVAWLMFGNTGSHALQFLFGIALARLLVPADFGMMATVHILTGVVSLVSSGGMGQSLVRAKEATPAEFDVIFTLQLAIGVLICGGIFAVAPWFARFFGNPLYVDLLVISALNFLLRPFAQIRTAWLNRDMNFRGTATANLTTTIVAQIACVSMAAAGMGVWSLSVGGLVGAAILNVMLYRLVPHRLRLRFDKAVVRRHAGFGFNITLLDLLGHLRSQAISLMLSKLAGPAALGLFDKAESLARLPNRTITPATGKVVFRALSKVVDDVDQSKYIFHRTIALLSAYVIPPLIGMYWVVEPLIGFLYGDKWLAAAEPARILVIGSLFLTTLRPCAVLLEARGRVRQELAASAVSVVFAVAACYVGLRWGLVGVAWATVLTHVFTAALMYGLVYRAIPIRLADLGRALAPAMILGGAVLGVLAATERAVPDLRTSAPFIYLCLMGGLGGAAYALAFLFLPIRGLESEALRWRGWLARMVRFLRVWRR